MRKFALLLTASLLLMGCQRDTTYDAFATCIAESDTTFYGAFWCPHCADQKKLFGDSADLLPYIECDPNGKNAQTEVCNDEKIQSYPTWRFPDGSKKTGVVSLEDLSELTSCPLPGEESIMVKEED
ncbi:MAG: hypothetical protein WC777_06175 [Candidatus Gracilibacteria bacterium]|jgi:hypothetical protein